MSFTLQQRALCGPLRAALPSNKASSSHAIKPISFNGAKQTRSRTIKIMAQSAGPVSGTGLSPELKLAIDTFISENKVVLFIKGTKQMPLCGFSNTVVQILNTMNVPYVTVNILEDDLLRSGMKEYSQWPTFPQAYIDGNFVGGADILIQMYQSGELQEVLEAALNS